MKVAIVGGGVSGITLSILLADFFDVTVFEKNNRILKKLLVTGNGRCNFSNEIMTRENFHGNDKFLDEFIKSADLRAGENFLKSIGIVSTTDERGRKYPMSLQANSVVDAYLSAISEKNITVRLDTAVEDIAVKNNKFIINYDYASPFDICILAPGSMSYPQFGTDGTSYRLATNLNHRKTRIVPGITSLISDIPFLKELKGVKIDGELSFNFNGKIYSYTGDILFTENGISGNTVFESSSIILDKKIKSVVLDFIPNISEADLIYMLNERKTSFSNRKVSWLLNGIIHKKLGNVILKILNLDMNKDLNELTESDFKNISRLIKNFNVNVLSGGSWKQSQVTVGGIDSSDLDINFQSKLIDNLFMVGEYLDIYGDCGGYNITFALVSAIRVCEFLRRKYAGTIS